jgi:hypothetical protein
VPAYSALYAALHDADAQRVRSSSDEVQPMRVLSASRHQTPGTYNAERRVMRADETWTIPLHIIMWTTITVGFIMALAVLMMH